MIRRFGETPHADQTYHLRPGAYALLPRDGKLLLTRQSEPEVDIQLPGGGIDPGESPLPALHREVFEETGWSIAKPRRLGAFRRFVYMPDYDRWAEKICHIYVARPVMRLGEPPEPHHSALWVSFSDAYEILENRGDLWFARQFMRGLM